MAHQRHQMARSVWRPVAWSLSISTSDTRIPPPRRITARRPLHRQPGAIGPAQVLGREACHRAPGRRSWSAMDPTEYYLDEIDPWRRVQQGLAALGGVLVAGTIAYRLLG